MAVDKIRLSEEKETLLITLYARALESRRRESLLGDRKADEVVRGIDYDFHKLRLGTWDALGLVLRVKQFDTWTAAFLAAQPDATVLHLACGLDSRVDRLRAAPEVQWFDVDYPEVIELRRRFWEERPGFRMIGASVIDPRWLDDIPADRPVMIVAEGLLMYLSEAEVGALLTRLTDRFATGQIAFDVLSPAGGKAAASKPAFKATGAAFRWVVDDVADIEKLNPRLELIEQTALLGSSFFSRMPWGFRVLCRTMNSVPTFRKMMRLLRYRF